MKFYKWIYKPLSNKETRVGVVEFPELDTNVVVIEAKGTDWSYRVKKIYIIK